MFKKLAFSGLMLSLLSLPLLAQQTTMPDNTTTTQRSRGRGMQAYQAGDPATRARKMTDRMTKQLGLDDASAKKVYDVTLARAEKVDAIQKGTDDNKAKGKALKANADEYKSKLQRILTPDQFAKLESMRGRMGRGRGNNDGDRDGQK